MEPIEPFGGAAFQPGNTEKRKVERNKSRRLTFSSIFTSRDEQADQSGGLSLSAEDEGANLEQLLDRVHEIGEKVKENATVATVQDYKNAVRSFVAFIVKKSLAVEQKESGANILKRKRFTLIRVIDQKLERFAAEILVGQREQLEVVRRVDELGGLLVDLMS